MKIYLNGAATDIGSVKLAEVLVELGYGGRKVATAVNESFVAESDRARLLLREGDRLEILAPMQGG